MMPKLKEIIPPFFPESSPSWEEYGHEIERTALDLISKEAEKMTLAQMMAKKRIEEKASKGREIKEEGKDTLI